MIAHSLANPLRGLRRSPLRRGAHSITIALLLASVSASAHDDYMDLSLDQLLDMAVSSVTRHAAPLATSPAAVYSLSGEQIRRSGAKSIAEALQMVPGLQVHRVDAARWAISARGFQSLFATKMLVMVDGRSVFSPTFSGVHWEMLDTYLPDIERIEVIRGPAAVLWGANAVNGIINIITRHSADTTGLRLKAGGGNEEEGFASLRAGRSNGGSASWRGYAQVRQRDAMRPADGSPPVADPSTLQAGFRGDWQLTDRDVLRASAGAIDGRAGADRSEIDFSETFLDLNWSRQQARGALEAQAWIQHYDRVHEGVLDEQRLSVALDVQQRLSLGDRNELTYGVGALTSGDDFAEEPAASFTPASDRVNNFFTFLQHRTGFADGRLELTLGARLERLYTVDFEFQPDIRIGWKPRDDFYAWASASAATRTPSRTDTGLTVRCPPGGIPGRCGPSEPQRLGNPDIDAERVRTLALGLRHWHDRVWSTDLALFYSEHEDLIIGEQGGSAFGTLDNTLESRSYGGEVSVRWQPREALALDAYYGHLDLSAHTDAGSSNTTSGPDLEGRAPRHSAGLRWNWRPLHHWSLDGDLRYVDELPFDDVPAYAELNLRLEWSPRSRLQLALVGRNLLDRRHREYGPDAPSSSTQRTEIERGVFAELTWSW